MTDATLNDPFAQTVDNVNHLEQLVGDGKKFATVEDLARGKAEADQFIETLKGELATLRTKAEQGMSLEQFYEKVRQGTTVGNDGQPIVDPKDSTASPEDIEKIVRDALSKTERERTTKTNGDTVIAKLNEAWGANASIELRKAADALGMSVEDLREVGLRSPAALFRMIGIGNTQTPSGTTAPTGSVAPSLPLGNVRNKAYYDKLYRENPKLREDSKIAAQEMRDALKLGESFF